MSDTTNLHYGPYEVMEMPRLPKKRGEHYDATWDGSYSLTTRHLEIAGHTNDIWNHTVGTHIDSIEDVLVHRKYGTSTDFLDAHSAISGDDLARLTRGA